MLHCPCRKADISIILPVLNAPREGVMGEDVVNTQISKKICNKTMLPLSDRLTNCVTKSLKFNPCHDVTHSGPNFQPQTLYLQRLRSMNIMPEKKLAS